MAIVWSRLRDALPRMMRGNFSPALWLFFIEYQQKGVDFSRGGWFNEGTQAGKPVSAL